MTTQSYSIYCKRHNLEHPDDVGCPMCKLENELAELRAALNEAREIILEVPLFKPEHYRKVAKWLEKWGTK